MPSSLFSTFRQGENRVTATMLAVCQRLDVSRLERLLAAAMGESSLQLVTFDNKPSVHDVPGLPDGRIAGSFALWIETKATANSAPWLLEEQDRLAEDADNLPPPAVIAAEIAEDLEAALPEFAEIASSFGPVSGLQPNIGS